MKNTRHYTVELEPLDDGGFFVSVPALPGCLTEGDNYEHAIAMAQEAIEGYLAVLIEEGKTIPVEQAPQEAVAVRPTVDLPLLQN